VIHGNNHTTEELSRAELQNPLELAAQAIRRMERLEKRHGIAFLKVMEPPHGALAKTLFPHLLVLGYEAAICTTELLVRHNPQAGWPATLGMARTEFLGGGLPVLPRIRLSKWWRNDILLAAFLRQPIIIAAHHYDAAHDMDKLAEIADTVNSVGGVIWSDIQGILRSNALQGREGEQLRVKMYSRRVRVTVPPGVRQLSIERPWLVPDRMERLVLASKNGITTLDQAGPIIEGLAVENGDVVEMGSELAPHLHCCCVRQLPIGVRPIARKFLMEARDRLSPMLPFVERLRRWQ